MAPVERLIFRSIFFNVPLPRKRVSATPVCTIFWLISGDKGKYQHQTQSDWCQYAHVTNRICMTSKI